jgi:hypothetical protein
MLVDVIPQGLAYQRILFHRGQRGTEVVGLLVKA